ncbi:MAG TPA: hydantoinase B/oxoprolinase family protein [Rhizomicrobium sp.]
MHKGGDGVVRRIRFREAMTAGILSTRRQTDPFGLEGGQPGARGANWVTRGHNARAALAGCDETAMAAGDSITIETPGGGGFGLIHKATDGLS